MNSFLGFFVLFALHDLSSATNYILHGQDAVEGDAPFQVSIRIKNEDLQDFGKGHYCGGSLISSAVVLTAAHCMGPYDFSFFNVVMGILNKRDKQSAFTAEILRYAMHPKYRDFRTGFDIALVLMDRRAPMIDKSIQIIPLPEKPVAAGTKCQVTGWGTMSANYPMKYPDKLQKVEVPIVDHQKCKEAHAPYRVIIKQMLCAGQWKGGPDSCYADSGGPLVCNNELVGIVSFGVSCGLKGFPGVYTNVHFFTDWIKDRTRRMEWILDHQPGSAV